MKLDSVLTEIINNTTLNDNKEILENFQMCMREPNKKEITLSLNRAFVRIEMDTEYECDDIEPNEKPEWKLN